MYHLQNHISEVRLAEIRPRAISEIKFPTCTSPTSTFLYTDGNRNSVVSHASAGNFTNTGVACIAEPFHDFLARPDKVASINPKSELRDVCLESGDMVLKSA